MPPDFDLWYNNCPENKNIPNIHWSFKCLTSKIDIGQILNQVNDEGGVIAVIETENTKPYTFVIYKTLR
jgi:hypothetical protein